LGLAGGLVLHSRAADTQDGPLSPDGGRILRPAPDKIDSVVLDHSGAVFRHGFVEDKVEWTLDPDKRAYSPPHAARLHSGYSSRLLECSQCGAIRIAGDACKHCGFLPQRRPDAIVFNDGDLALVDRRKRTAVAAFDAEERARWHGMLTAVAKERRYRSGWIYHKYHEKFGVDPPVYSVKPISPTPEVLSWVRSRVIAFVKASE
jgi:DNA repair protein RadD